LEALQEQIARENPHAQVVGAESPPFRAASYDELRERDARIAASGATIVWVGLGTPKQDAEVQRLAAALPVMAMAVGAAGLFACTLCYRPLAAATAAAAAGLGFGVAAWLQLPV
ncbi:MAG: WecB/TagA/CpsF family glycosyltransferase, partial [Opitutaceae bacterium]